jgi:hypothetical protein
MSSPMWVALTAAAPNLCEERTAFLRLLGRGRLGSWLWEPCPDGREPILRMLRPNQMLVAYPVGHPEVHAGLFAFDVIHFDAVTRLPQRIVEHSPMTLRPEQVDDAVLADKVFSEFRVEDRHPNGVPRRASWTHRSKDLVNFRWTCVESQRVDHGLREALADASACPASDSEHPIQRADAFLAPVEPRRPKTTPGVDPETEWAAQPRAVAVRPIGIVLAVVGAVWMLLRKLVPARVSESARAT